MMTLSQTKFFEYGYLKGTSENEISSGKNIKVYAISVLSILLYAYET